MSYRIDRGVEVSASQLLPNPWNPNKMTQRQQAAISESLGHYGQVLELLVRPHPSQSGQYQVIDGEHRLSELPEKVFVNVIYDLPDAEAKKLTIIMNGHGQADKVALAQLLAEIDVELGEQTGIALPYESKELAELIDLASIDWNQYGSEESGGSSGSAGGDEWVTVYAKLPKDAMERVQDVYNLIDEERGGLHQDKAIAWGQVLESIAADYLATPR